VGSMLQVHATGSFDDASLADIWAAVVWSACAPVVQLATDGTATGASAGSATINASLGGKSGSATVTVTAATLVRIDLAPASLALPLGQSQQVSATGHFSDNSTLDLTDAASWLSSAPAIAAVSNAATGPRGKVSALSAGSAVVTVKLGMVTATLPVAVAASPLVSLTLTPATASLAPGAKKAFTVSGTFADSTTADLTQAAVWSSSDATTVGVSNASGTRGEATALKPGMAQVRASFGGMTGTGQVTVNALPTVDGLTVAPAAVTIDSGATVPLKAMALYTDGTL